MKNDKDYDMNDLPFTLTFAPKSQTTTYFVIRPILTEDIIPLTQLTASVFCSSEPLMSSLNFTLEEVLPFMKIIVENNVEKGMGVVCCLRSTGEYASVLLCEDMYEPTDARKKTCEISQGFEQKNAIMALALDPCLKAVKEYYEKPDKIFQTVNLKVAVTAPKFQGLGLMSKLVQFVVNEHPMTKLAKLFFTSASNKGSQTCFERAGFKTVYEIVYKNMNVKGEKPFEDMEENLKKKGLKPTDKFKFMVLHKSQGLLLSN